MRTNKISVAALTLAAALCLSAASPAGETWLIDSVDQIGGHAATVLGHPRVIAAPGGKAVEFNGVDDALFLDVHPLVGAATWTWEVVFRPDVGGAAEQRFLSLSGKRHGQPDAVRNPRYWG